MSKNLEALKNGNTKAQTYDTSKSNQLPAEPDWNILEKAIQAELINLRPTIGGWLAECLVGAFEENTVKLVARPNSPLTDKNGAIFDTGMPFLLGNYSTVGSFGKACISESNPNWKSGHDRSYYDFNDDVEDSMQKGWLADAYPAILDILHDENPTYFRQLWDYVAYNAATVPAFPFPSPELAELGGTITRAAPNQAFNENEGENDDENEATFDPYDDQLTQALKWLWQQLGEQNIQQDRFRLIETGIFEELRQLDLPKLLRHQDNYHKVPIWCKREELMEVGFFKFLNEIEEHCHLSAVLTCLPFTSIDRVPVAKGLRQAAFTVELERLVNGDDGSYKSKSKSKFKAKSKQKKKKKPSAVTQTVEPGASDLVAKARELVGNPTYIKWGSWETPNVEHYLAQLLCMSYDEI